MRLLALALLLAATPLAAQPCALPRFSAPAPILRNTSAPADGFNLSEPVTGDFDGDGHADVATIDPVESAVVLLFGDGHGGFLPPQRTAPGARLIRTGNFDGDHRTDLLVVRGSELQVLFVESDRSFRWGPVTQAEEGSETMIADVDGDGSSDVILGLRGSLSSSARLVTYRSDRLGGFSSAVSTPLSANSLPGGFVAADFNGDGKADVVVDGGHRVSGAAFYRGLGNGLFELTAAPAPSIDLAKLIVADFNEDGLPDLLVTGAFVVPTTELYLGNRSGGLTFAGYKSVDTVIPGSPFALGDFDGNGLPDVLLHGSSLIFYAKVSVPPSGGRQLMSSKPNKMLAVDVDGDGVSDLVTQRFDGGLDLWRNGCSQTHPDFVLPSVVSVDGVGGTHFESQLTLTNRSRSTMTLELTFGPEANGNRATYTLPSGQKTFPSALEFLRGLGLTIPTGNGVGRLAFHVLAGPPSDLAAQVRTTSQARNSVLKGGVAFVAVPSTRAFTTSAWIPWLKEDATNRTNLALVHAGGATEGPLTLRVLLTPIVDGVPGPVSTTTVTLEPGEFRQIDHILRTLFPSAANGYTKIERVTGTAPWLAYAVVNVSDTGDGSVLPAIAQEALMQQHGSLIVPAIVENARYESELVVTNTSSVSRQLVATWRPIGFPSITATLEISAGGQLDLTDFVQWLRDRGVANVPPRGVDLAGSLELRTASGDPEGILAGARTATTTGGFGVFTPATAASDAVRGERVWLFGLRQDAEVRTNLALVNLSPFVSRFDISIHDASSPATKTISDVRLGPGEWLQLGRILTMISPAMTEAYAEIGGGSVVPFGGAPASFLTYAVINEGAEPGQGSGDGSYVPMQDW
ncbi:MAG: VCBS repeat-containing protein [Thermoanaerobaculia bacterium]